MIVREVYVKNILSKSKVLDYTVNPYFGCEHDCSYCYARFMIRFSKHKEKWGEFVDVKINAATLLQHELGKKKVGRIWISGICDPYQPLERKYEITKRCLEVLSKKDWPVTIQTKSPLVLRDIELLKSLSNLEVILTITTADDKIRQIFESKAPPIEERLQALEKLHSAGIRTLVMIAPMLPNVEGLVQEISGKVDGVLMDKMNYHYADGVYKKYGLDYAKSEEFFQQKRKELAACFRKAGIRQLF